MPRTVFHMRGACLARRFGLLLRIGLGRFITLRLLVTTDAMARHRGRPSAITSSYDRRTRPKRSAYRAA